MTTFSQYIIKHESALFSSVWSYRIVRVVLSAVFLRSGTTKLLDPEAFGIIEAENAS